MKKFLTGILVLSGLNLMAQKPAVVTGTEEGWYKIGRISADSEQERESIIVMGNDEFAKIKLRVSDAPINIDRLQIHFEGGKVQDVDLKQPLKEGEESTEIVLEAGTKEIDKVVFTYSTAARNGEKAEVELYGFKDYGAGKSKESPGIREESEESRDGIERKAGETRHDTENVSGQAETREAVREEDDLDDVAENTRDDRKEDAEKIRDETREHVNKGEAEIMDRELEGKVGPGGQAIYVDDNNAYYYIDEKGNKIYVDSEELTDRVRE